MHGCCGRSVGKETASARERGVASEVSICYDLTYPNYIDRTFFPDSQTISGKPFDSYFGDFDQFWKQHILQVISWGLQEICRNSFLFSFLHATIFSPIRNHIPRNQVQERDRHNRSRRYEAIVTAEIRQLQVIRFATGTKDDVYIENETFLVFVFQQPVPMTYTQW